MLMRCESRIVALRLSVVERVFGCSLCESHFRERPESPWACGTLNLAVPRSLTVRLCGCITMTGGGLLNVNVIARSSIAIALSEDRLSASAQRR